MKKRENWAIPPKLDLILCRYVIKPKMGKGEKE